MIAEVKLSIRKYAIAYRKLQISNRTNLKPNENAYMCVKCILPKNVW